VRESVTVGEVFDYMVQLAGCVNKQGIVEIWLLTVVRARRGSVVLDVVEGYLLVATAVSG
jgi:hypothetical protein